MLLCITHVGPLHTLFPLFAYALPIPSPCLVSSSFQGNHHFLRHVSAGHPPAKVPLPVAYFQSIKYLPLPFYHGVSLYLHMIYKHLPSST